jgi:hypothetical protein
MMFSFGADFAEALSDGIEEDGLTICKVRCESFRAGEGKKSSAHGVESFKAFD